MRLGPTWGVLVVAWLIAPAREAPAAEGQPAPGLADRALVVRAAEDAMTRGPFSVLQKTRVPPSGDKHDFLTLAPYWWPDPATPGGLPYVRRDGEVNPESRRDTDEGPFHQMVSAVSALARGYQVTGDQRFAARAALLLRTWFLDPATRMNPNLEYGQGIPGRTGGRGAGIITTRRLVQVVDAVRAITSSSGWTTADDAGLKAWCAAYATWLRTSRHGRDEARAENNHGTWYDVQLVSLLLHTGRVDEARKVIDASAKKRIASQIEPDGRQPRELARTRAWSYSVMNLEGWFTLARLADEAGIDLWRYQTKDGRSLRGALDYLVPFAEGRAPWTHQQITPFRPADLAPLLAQGADAWGAEHYRTLADRLQERAPSLDVGPLERARVLRAADAFLGESPVTVTASRSPRSAGGPHDYFSEGDYWWPDPANPDGPYVQRDGMTNPANFVDHRRAMVRLSIQVGTLTSAYLLTADERYAAHALAHLRAWFVDEATRMTPHLLYAQAIRGRATGRGVGIIDTIHLVEVAQATRLLASSRSARPEEIAAVKRWFAEYLAWLTTHQYGIDERDAKNNHATCWVMQVAAFAQLTGDTAALEDCRRRYKEILLPRQMAPDGSFPLELARTKPYGYSLFNLDAFATICQILSTPADSLWKFTLPDGRGMRVGLAFMLPYVRSKAAWPHAKDVMYFDEWPVRSPAWLFGGLAFGDDAYVQVWRDLPEPPAIEEVLRNLPIRHPLLWLSAPPLPALSDFAR
jgi:hypothetical protein